MKRVQQSALKTVIGTTTKARNINTLIETGQLPVEKVIQNRTADYFYKLKTMDPDMPVNKLMNSLENNLYKLKSKKHEKYDKYNIIQQIKQLESTTPSLEIPMSYLPTSTPPQWALSQITTDTTLAQRNKNQEPHIMKTEFQLEMDTKYKNHIQIYTDGSLIPDKQKAGYGIYFPLFYNGFGQVTDHSNIFRTELKGIEKAIQMIKLYRQNVIPHNKFVIITDCMSTITCLEQNTQFTRAEEISIKTEIDKLTQEQVEVVIKWAPSHIGIIGNEKADKLAKLAATNAINTNDPKTLQCEGEILPTPPERKNTTQKAIWDQWEKELLKTNEHKTISNLLNIQTLKVYNKNRKEQSRISRIRTKGEYYKYRKEQSLCECKENFDTEHVLMHCPLNKDARQTCKQAIEKENIAFTTQNLTNPPIEISQWLWEITNTIITDHPLSDRI